MSDVAISVSGISKNYTVFGDQRSRLLHAIWPSRSKGVQEVRALNDISFEIRRGESVAIIGRNGGGKSTLLEILTGTLTPSAGRITVNGRVSALLELGSGFNPEYSGRDNVILNGLLLGLTREEITGRFGEIEAFAEIGAAIERPVKTYSSGMMMRLAFAVQVLSDPDILIIDEALSVGDFFFQQKCLSYIRGLCARGVTLLFVSHDMGTVRDLCPRVIYLQKGQLRFDGDSAHGLRLFFKEKTDATIGIVGDVSQGTTVDNGSLTQAQERPLEALRKTALWISPDQGGAGKLVSVSVLDAERKPRMSFRIGDKMIIQIAFTPDPTVVTHVSLAMSDKFGLLITTIGTLQLNELPVTREGGALLFELEVDLMVEAGQYGLAFNLSFETEKNRGQVLDETGVLGPIDVNWDYESETAPFLGKFGLPTTARYLALN